MPAGMMGAGAQAMQGLSAATPPAPEAAAPPAGPEQAMMVLQDAISQYGPGIVDILRELLAGAGAGDMGAGGGQPPMDPAAGGMM